MNGMFIAEGVKLVQELLYAGMQPQYLFALENHGFPGATAVSESELKQLSTLVQPNKVLGVFPIPKSQTIQYGDWVLALDGVRDPGNLGTLIRLCDWFGIEHLLCSPDTVDAYNPKVLQATMGSISRVNISYAALGVQLSNCNVPIYGASMEGIPSYSGILKAPGVLVMGNEAHGLSPEIRSMIHNTVAIPAFGGAESLNVASASAILLYEIRRSAIIQK